MCSSFWTLTFMKSRCRFDQVRQDVNKQTLNVTPTDVLMWLTCFCCSSRCIKSRCELLPRASPVDVPLLPRSCLPAHLHTLLRWHVSGQSLHQFHFLQPSLMDTCLSEVSEVRHESETRCWSRKKISFCRFTSIIVVRMCEPTNAPWRFPSFSHLHLLTFYFFTHKIRHKTSKKTTNFKKCIWKKKIGK